ncbi:CaiB/BaiF CoA-transferase family protein [Mycobacterium terramassiliense]|uniref:CaiB/BaiF CoA-transferase family protein n=1 Tax=Mycobacterium terramassiliense TaxID=1841859 RepID=UPI00097DB2FF|nr:CoA transferase [Mycobacterium terramassiliense]
MAARAPFADWRVLELSNGIAASYCGKMFVDAGAEVVKIESPHGDSVRRWSARPGGPAGALFGYLAAGKKSVNDDAQTAALLAGADLVITDLTDGWTLDSITAHTGAAAVVVAVTPFGMTGPYVEDQVVANEFILQALCGSIASRGWPGDEPVQAGGRLGEWLAGTFAAAVAAATARHAARSGRGEVIDVSTYEAMVIAMGGLSTMSASVLGADSLLYQRSLELPSIVATADGMVGFCTITAQQFQDFLIMIDRADLVDDAELASFAGRVQRRDEFLAMVTRWTESRTTQEIIDVAVAFRIPVAPIATPASLPTVDHFVQRGVFVESALGVLQPRVPYRSEAMITRPPGQPPRLGADNGRLHWPARPRRPDGPGADADALPLCDIRITDLTAFWAGPVATQLLGALGADVIKLEGVRRPDGMRFSAGRPPDWDQWWEWGPVFLCSNNNKRGISVELSTDAGRAIALELMAASDLVIENFSPRVMGNFGLTWDAVAAANPRAVMVRMPAFGLDGPWRDRVGFAQTMEQATGMAWMTGHADGPPVIPRGVCDPIAGLHAAFAAIAALAIRDRDGAGMHVESTMVEAALNVAAEMLVEYSRNGVELRREGNRGPGATPQGVYPCPGDDEWVALAATDDAARASLARLIERPELDPHEGAWRERADEIDKLIADWTARHPVAEAVAALRGAGVPAARVTAPAALLSDPQLLARGFWETVDHPVAGSFLCTGMPFAFVGRPRRWIRRVPPLYGQHTDEVLTGILGRSQQDLLELRAAGATSVRPAGL